MTGGVGYSWFKLTLVDEPKKYTYLTGTIKVHEKLGVTQSKSIHLKAIQKDYNLQGVIGEQVQTGSILEHYFTGVLGGGKDE